MRDDPSIATQVFKIPYQNKFEENNRIDTLLTFTAIVFFCFPLNPLKIEDAFKPVIKIILRHQIR